MSIEETPGSDVCPSGEEVEAFHGRIFDGLLDAYNEQTAHARTLTARPPEELDKDDHTFLQLYKTLSDGLPTLKSPELTYDQKYALAQKLQNALMEMELL
ncbi:MAG: hypothetical protein HQL50_02265 [Magnetococcales bacterium]|nr:hypothetical protein [Magnetococcales bacterium]